MATLNVNQLKREINSGQVQNAYYLYGNDPAAVLTLTLTLIKKLLGDNYSLYLQKYDGQDAALDLDSIEDTAGMYPFGCEYNVILLDNYNASKRKSDENNKISEIIKESLGTQTVIIISVTSFDVLEGRSKIPASSKNKKLIDLVGKFGAVGICNKRTDSEVAADIVRYVQKNGGKISGMCATEISKRCLCLSDPVKNETDKLISYADGREIDMHMIELLCPKQDDMKIYELATAISFGNVDKVIKDYHILQESIEPDSILFSVTDTYINWYRAALGNKSRKSADDIQNDFDYRLPFVVRNAVRDSRKFNIKYLRECVRILRDMQIDMNSTAVDRNKYIETTLVKLMLLRGNIR